MNIKRGYYSCRVAASAGVIALLLSQPGCRRSSEEKPEEAPKVTSEQPAAQTEQPPVLAAEEEAKPAVMETQGAAAGGSQAVRKEIEECQARLRAISVEIGALHKETAVARRKVRTENAEIGEMVKEAGQMRKTLGDKVHGLPGTDERLSQRTALQKEIQELQKQRQELATRAKDEDAEALMQEAEKLDEDIRGKGEAIRNLSLEIEKARRDARKNDPEIKTLTSKLVEQEHLIETKIKASPEVAGLIAKQGELMAEAREVTQRMKELREKLAARGK